MSLDIKKVIEKASPLIKAFEGLSLKPYLCEAKIPTIGYGSTYYLDGRKVSLADPSISLVEAEVLFKETLKNKYLLEMLILCPGLETVNQAAAILSWTYNLGSGNLKTSTLRRVINKKEFERVPKELLKWNLANGKVSRGLVKRRQSEVNLFIS